MKPKFINQFDITLTLYKEWSKNPISQKAKQNKKKSLLKKLVGCLCSVILIILGVIWREQSVVLLGSLFFIFSLYAIFLLPNSILKKQYKSMVASQKTNMITLKHSFADNLLIENGRSTSKYEYSEIIKVSEDDDYFYLFLSFDSTLRVRKDSFILGSCDDFRKFINNSIS